MENNIYHTDAKSLLTTLADEGVKSRLIITDPPFNTTKLSWDSKRIDFDDLAQDLLRILDRDGWLFLFGTIEMSAVFLKYFNIRFTYIWKKPNFVRCTKNTVRPSLITEFIFAFTHPNLVRPTNLTYHPDLLFTDGHIPYQKSSGNQGEFAKAQGFNSDRFISKGDNTRKPTNVLEYPNKPCMKLPERTPHPTQKPIDLLRLLIKGYSNHNDLIIDPFAGSGTTLVAAKELGRQYIGCEIDSRYIKIIRNRLDTVQFSLL